MSDTDIRSKLSSVMDSLQMQAEDVAEGEKFDFFKAGNLREALKAELTKRSVDMELDTASVDTLNGLFVVELEVTFHDLQSGEEVSSTWFGGANNSDKSVSTAQTNALKHYIRNRFLIGDEEADGDAYQGAINDGRQATDRSDGDSDDAKGGPGISDNQQGYIRDLVDEVDKAIDRDATKKVADEIFKAYDINSKNELKTGHGRQIVSWLLEASPQRTADEEDVDRYEASPLPHPSVLTDEEAEDVENTIFD